MNKYEYLEQNNINDFILWIEPFLDNSFSHSYKFKKSKTQWNCNSIYNAYEKYTWSNKSKTFEESHKELYDIKTKLQNALTTKNEKNTIEACIEILKWGGLENKNDEYIKNNPSIVDELIYIKNKINLNNYDIDKQTIIDIKINSGFSKIYSILLDEYIIYDSRVSVAICLLVRNFCEKNNLQNIPNELLFAFSKGRVEEGNRNPNNLNHVFPNLYPNNYLENNIKASWLLSGILEKTISKFTKLPKNIQLRALEAAFFMIGYEI